MTLNNKTGLEWMQAMLDQSIALPEMLKTVPMQGVLVEKGHVIFEVFADTRHSNVFGGVHGGFSATVLDTATGCAVHTMLNADTAYATIDLNIKMCRPVPMDVPLIAEANLINISKSLAIAEGQLKDQAGKLYAHATATCMLLVKESTTP